MAASRLANGKIPSVQRLEDRFMPRYFPKSPATILGIGRHRRAIVGALAVAFLAGANRQMQSALGPLKAALPRCSSPTNKGGIASARSASSSAIAETEAGINYAGN